MMIDKILNITIGFLSEEKTNKNQIDKLKKLFKLECQYNLRLLDTIEWKGLGEDFIIEICTKLKSDAAYTVYAYIDESFLKYLFKTEKANKEDYKSTNISSLITRIEVLKTIATLTPERKKEAKTNYGARLKHLRDLLLKILKELKN